MPANVPDLAVEGSLLHGDEAVVQAGSGYRGIARWCDTPGATRMVAKPRRASGLAGAGVGRGGGGTGQGLGPREDRAPVSGHKEAVDHAKAGYAGWRRTGRMW